MQGVQIKMKKIFRCFYYITFRMVPIRIIM
nr:MAG TPA: hypothetical protein [Caudoviricetes sp.]